MSFEFNRYTRIHEEGKPYFWVSCIAFILSLATSGVSVVSLLFLIAVLCIVGFFRNPKRVVPTDSGIIVSPADGVILSIDKVAPIKSFGLDDKEMLRIRIFMSVFDVHVNRVPIAGKIVKKEHFSGKFYNAAKPKSTESNEHNILVIESESGKNLACVQVAGLLARRIVCDVEVGDFLATGELFGIIKFGSRVDVYLPSSCKSNVRVGQTVIGGETALSRMD